METSIIHIRPRFKLTVARPKEEVQAKAKALIAQYKGRLKARIIQDHLLLMIHDEEAHYWSPQMDFRIETDEDFPEHTSIAGLIGPRPQVWTMFVFFYLSVGVIGFFLTSHGVSQYLLDKPTPTIWAFPIALLIMLTAYQAGKFGENKGRDQIEMLKQFVRDLVAN